MVRYQNGLDYLAARNPAAAEQEWLQGTREDAGFLDCYLQLGDLYVQQQRRADAARAYEAAARLAPQDGTIFLRLSQVQQALGGAAAGEAASRRAAQLSPNDPDAQGLHGLLAARLRRDAEAFAALQRAHSLRPSDREYLLGFVWAAIKQGKLPLAEQSMAPYLKAHPDDVWANHAMMVILASKPRTPGALQTALKHAQRVYAMLPGEEDVITTLGKLYLEANRPADAAKIYRSGLRARPQAEALLSGLAACYARLGQPRKAEAVAALLRPVAVRSQLKRHLTIRLQFNPRDNATRLKLARLAEEAGDAREAIELYTRAVRQAPHDMSVRRAFAACLERLNQPERARRILRPNEMQ